MCWWRALRANNHSELFRLLGLGYVWDEPLHLEDVAAKGGWGWEEFIGCNALHIAARLGFDTCVEVLARGGEGGGGGGACVLNLDVRDKRRKATALHYACEYKHVPCAKLLLQLGAGKDVVDKLGETPLHKACRCV